MPTSAKPIVQVFATLYRPEIESAPESNNGVYNTTITGNNNNNG